MKFYDDPLYSGKLTDLTNTLTTASIKKYPDVKGFNSIETKNILKTYMEYILNNDDTIKPITVFTDKAWLSNIYYKNIVGKLKNNLSQNSENMGLRDRAWVILAELKKVSDTIPEFSKFYNPFPFQIEFFSS